MNAHFRNKTYKCQYCPKAFYENSSLSGHIEIMHERDTEKYSCDYCDFKTYSGDIMNNHKRIHFKYNLSQKSHGRHAPP